YFISYHDLNYNRWSDFFSSFIQLMKVFQQYDNSIFINAFSLHYVDEFLWTDEGNPIDSSVIFARNSKYLPSEFFKPGKTNFSFITERHLESGSKVFDRIEVKVEPTIVPVVNISHSVTYPLTDFYHLNSVVDNSFSPFFESVHAKNKALLRDLLNPEVCKLIGI
ncbi:MAG: TIGR04255 family protein, partial [Cyclobacteriaceae bacterium]